MTATTRHCFSLTFFLLIALQVSAGDIDDKAVVKNTIPKKWQTFSLHNIRLSNGSPFYNAMKVNQQFMLGADVERMLNTARQKAGLPLVTSQYPGSAQPVATRPLYLDHYLSAISLMYAQTGDEKFLERSNYIVQTLVQCEDKLDERRKAGDTSVDKRITDVPELAKRLQ